MTTASGLTQTPLEILVPNGTHNISTHKSTADTITNKEAVEFLQQLRPSPWILVAINPTDNHITTITANSTKEADAFVTAHNGKSNLYYSVNPTKTAMYKKPAKIDIAAIEYLLGDLDPSDDETPEV